MRRTACLGLALLAGTVAFMASASGQTDGDAAPIYGVRLPAGYRDWPLISVATVGAPVSDMRAKLGNEVAMNAFRAGTLPFPDGTIIARLAWTQTTSEENNRALGPAAEKQLGPGGSEAAVTVVRRRARNQCAVHGERLEEVRVNRGLGVRAVRRRQAGRRGGAQDVLCVSRACQRP
jgi:hypothetical protein